MESKKEKALKILNKLLPKYIDLKYMQKLEENCKLFGIDSLTLMENAGREVAREIEKIEGKGKNVVIVSGLGNNGGDSFVAARYLSKNNKVKVFLLGKEEEIKRKEALINWDRLKKTFVEREENVDEKILKREIKNFDYCIVAITGRGFRGKLNEKVKRIIKLLNSLNIRKYSVDVPSGLGDFAIFSFATITFHKPKKEFFGNERFFGKEIVVDIGIPKEAEIFVGEGDLNEAIKPISLYTRKRERGYVLIVGGSSLYSGAPALAAFAAEAAFKTGCGSVRLVVPESIGDVVRSYSPEFIVKKVKGKDFSKESIEEIKEMLNVDSILLGPGIGKEKSTKDFVNSFLQLKEVKEKPIVIDADALNLLEIENANRENVILTPHLGEFYSLCGKKVKDEVFEKVLEAYSFVKKLKLTILLKGHETVIANKEKIKINITSSPSLSVAGSGDVLAGIITSFLARKVEPFTAACAGAYLHGLIGIEAEKSKGMHATPKDFISLIPSLLKNFDKISN
ncbi:MAG: NAD(P)H-hydrate dehydratase [Candidatus Micrarchaeales archaeon]